MPLIKSTELRCFFNLGVTKKQINNFDNVIKVKHCVHDWSREDRKVLQMMNRYLSSGRNYYKVIKIKSLLSFVERKNVKDTSIKFDYNNRTEGKLKNDPRFVSELLEGVFLGRFQHFSGANRDVYIDFDNGVGYKIFKKIVLGGS
ncbi:hypothetical protein G5Y07_004507 [Vibrio parahaemolyticus]|nr:hypothetical protein [Vibrio parahaemolyticus]